MLDSFLRTIFFRVVRNLKRDAIATRGDQQAERKTMAPLAAHLLVIVATAFLGAPLSVARAVGVLCLPTRLAGQGRVDNKDEFALAVIQLNQRVSQRSVEIVLLPARSSQKTGHLSAMNRFRGDAPGRLRAAHAAPVTN